MLEAPVTGGLEALKKGQMTVFLAGEKEIADEMMPMMEDIYCNVLYTGIMGTALIPKVLSNMLTCVHNLAMGEVFMVGKRAGVDMRVMWDAIRASSGNSFVWETGGPMLMQGTYDPSFSIALLSIVSLLMKIWTSGSRSLPCTPCVNTQSVSRRLFPGLGL